MGKVFQDRQNLAASLRDAKSIVKKLETVIGVAIHILFGFFYLLIFGVDVLKTWATFASFLIGFSFIFGTSIRTTCELHPPICLAQRSAAACRHQHTGTH